MSIEPGWYPAEGDPPNTVRYWDGSQWQGGPQAPAQQPNQVQAAPQQFSQPAPEPITSTDPYAPTPADQTQEPQTPPPAWGQVPVQDARAPQPASESQVQPGWYQAAGDPPNTIRYWDGSNWQGGPRAAGGNFAPGGTEGADTLTPLQYFKRAYTSRYADFQGRARRAEFGWFVLIFWVIFFVVAFVTGGSDGESVVAGLFWLASLVPYFALSVRRLHDMNVSGWAALAILVPFVNLIFFLVLLFSDSRPHANSWGRSPKYG